MKLHKASILFILFSFCQFAFAGGGSEAGNGGSGAVAEFYKYASDAIWNMSELFVGKEYAKVGPDLIATGDLIHLLDGVAVTETDKPLYLNGEKVSAINYPKSKKIIFNFKDWRQFDRRSKLNLIFHELISLKLGSQFSDKNYQYSRPLTDQILNFENSKVYYCGVADLTVRRTDTKYSIENRKKIERISDDGLYRISFENIDGVMWIGVIKKETSPNTKYALYTSTTGGEISLGIPLVAFSCRRAGTRLP